MAERPGVTERFWTKVRVADDGCWVWTAGTNVRGYGRFKSGGRKVLPHRWLYTETVGAIPPGLQLYHLCRNPACVNPAHLEPVTAANAAKAVCPRGHGSYDRVYAGHRRCSRCDAARYQRGKAVSGA